MNSKETSREKIIEAALHEFAVKGYRGASTNSICKHANLSKGLLYHHYQTKENLYLTVVQHVINEFKRNIKIQIDQTPKSGIDYISEYFNAKFKYFRENPLHSKIIMNVVLNDHISEAEVLFKTFEAYNNNLIYDVIQNIEMNPKFDKEKAFELITMIGDKLEEKHLKNADENDKEKVLEAFRADHKVMIEMVFEGIDK